MTDTLERLALAVELPPGDDGAPPEWIPLLPAGELHARDGRRWTHDAPEDVLAASRTHAGATPPVVDYEHQTDHAPANGQPAPAAGWVRELAVRDGALWGRIEWTARAAAHIVAREYRFISPTFTFDKQTRQIRALHRAALTNAPALDMPALARTEGDTMTPEQLAALVAVLGLAETATADEIQAAARASAETAAATAQVLGSIATALGLTETASADDVLAAARAHTAPDPGQFVPRAEFDRVAADLTTLQTERTEERATAAVDAAVKAGKIAPAQRDWALGYARGNPEQFDVYVASAPAILALQRIGNIAQSADPNAALDDTELAVCSRLGRSADEFKASRTEIAGRVAQ